MSQESSPPSGDGTLGPKAEILNRRKKGQLYQTEAHKQRTLYFNGLSERARLQSGAYAPDMKAPNPIWANFPTRCVQPITTAEEMKRKMQYFSHSDEVMVVRYHQNGCTACNAVDKTFEFICHESKKYLLKLHFYDINKDEAALELTKGLVRFPQVKGFSGGQWADIDFKPPNEYRETLYRKVELKVREANDQGQPITALQAEEMYFSLAGPSMYLILQESIQKFYNKSQVRLRNYWKQVSVRRTWFFKKFVEPNIDEHLREKFAGRSVFGEAVYQGPELPDA
jgi:hypothetical protein